MLTTISKTFDFDAAHRLDRLPEEHKCHRLHGHTYRVEVRVRGEPGRRLGMVIDYADLAAAWQPLHDQLDHRYLNEVPGLEVSTTELIAAWIYDRLLTAEVQIEHPEKHGVEWKSLGGMPLAVIVFESSSTFAKVGANI